MGVTRHRVLALIRAGRLRAERVGMQFLIRPADLDAVRDRKPGRPPKAAPAVKGTRGKGKGGSARA